MLTFLAEAEARHRDLQREVAELRLWAAARTVDPAPPGPSASARRARTVSRLKGDVCPSPLRLC